MDQKLTRLTDIGFTRAGQWQRTATGLAVHIEKHQQAQNILYAFVVAGELCYIGKTVQPLAKRMAGYRTPGPSQSTNIKNNHNIRTALDSGKIVEIHVLPDNGLMQYGGFHLNLAAGLEDDLIKQLKPPWNAGQKETVDEQMVPITQV